MCLLWEPGSWALGLIPLHVLRPPTASWLVFFPPLEQLCAEELQYSLEHDAYQIISGGGKVHKTQRKNPDDEYREGMKKKKWGLEQRDLSNWKSMSDVRTTGRRPSKPGKPRLDRVNAAVGHTAIRWPMFMEGKRRSPQAVCGKCNFCK